MNRRGLLVWSAAVAVALFAAVACGQGSDEPTPRAVSADAPPGGGSGGIAGIVTDADGAPVAGIRVGIVSGTAAFPEIAPETDAVGSYRINNVQPGTFEVAVHDRDGKQIGLESVVVNSGETASRDFSVSVGAAALEEPAVAAPPVSTANATKEPTEGLCLPAGPLAVEVGDSWTISGPVSMPVEFPSELPQGTTRMSSTFTLNAIETSNYSAGRGSPPIEHPSVKLGVTTVALDADGNVLSTEDNPGSWAPASVGNLGPVLTLDWECHGKSWLTGWPPDVQPSVGERTLSSGVTAVVFSVKQPLVIPAQGIDATMERHHGYDKATGRVVLQEARATGTVNGSPLNMEMLQELEPGGSSIAPPGTGPDFCQEYLDLMVSFDQGMTEERAVVTSYRCMSSHVDSTGRYPSPSASSILPADSPLSLRLAAETEPMTVDVRLYPVARVSGSFLKWPEELPTGEEPVETLQPTPSRVFQFSPEAPPGEYSLVVRATWDGPVDVFYAVNFRLV